jgi:hypothetical protein
MYIFIYIYICIDEFTYVSIYVYIYIYVNMSIFGIGEVKDYLRHSKKGMIMFCVHYLCLIGRMYVFYVGHADKSSLYETLFHCNILSKHHHHRIGKVMVCLRLFKKGMIMRVLPFRIRKVCIYIYIYMYVYIDMYIDTCMYAYLYTCI